MEFGSTIRDAYATEGAALELGLGVHEGAVAPEAAVRMPLATLNRHGLIAGATGTGKTKTMQVIAEQLSEAGVPVLVCDVKGDVSGLAAPGASEGPAPARAADLGLPYEPRAYPVEFLALGGIGPGVPVRATVSDFGPELLGKILEANETQEQSLQLLFRFADEQGLPIVDLADLRALLTWLASKEGRAELEGLGGVAPATIGVLQRSLVQLEDGGGSEFFGERAFDVADLMRTMPDGRGVISSVELPAVQGEPRLWSTALMSIVAELFETLPEAGDLAKPKLVVFIEEAHLLFTDATEAFLESIVQTVRLIRSKGVGVFFVTQTPKDVPTDVLAQLGNRIQHALRAFTPDDAKALRATVSTYPKSDFYDLEELLPQLGIGEAAVTILSESGVPTPVVHTRLRPPRSRMGPVDDVAAAAAASPLAAKYAERVDPQSARELLAERVERQADDRRAAEQRERGPGREQREPAPRRKQPDRGRGDPLTDFLGSRQGRQIQREVIRGVFGMLRKRL